MTEMTKTGGLIVPKRVAANHRPYASASPEDLLRELEHRKILQELSLQAMMPDAQKLLDMQLTPEQTRELETSAFRDMFTQAIQAIVTQGFAYTGEGYAPPSTAKILVLKLLVIKHPLAP